MPPTNPYNPLDKGSIGDNIVRELIAQPCIPLPAPKVKGGKRATDENAFEGAGITQSTTVVTLLPINRLLRQMLKVRVKRRCILARQIQQVGGKALGN